MSEQRAFLMSAWFVKVESIFSSPTAAEHFYAAALATYFDLDANATCDQYVLALRGRAAHAWDDRLTQPARVFYATARTATAFVGLGRFVRGAFGLGRSKLTTAMDQIACTLPPAYYVSDCGAFAIFGRFCFRRNVFRLCRGYVAFFDEISRFLYVTSSVSCFELLCIS